MAVTILKTDIVTGPSGAKSASFGQLLSVGASGNPAYLVVDILDRNEYTANAGSATGSFSGSGKTLQLGNTGGDGRGAGIVFTWQPASGTAAGQYVNATYGSLSQLSYTISANATDLSNISVFGETSLSQATQYASNAYSLMQTDAAGYLGSITFASDPNFKVAAPSQATPLSIAAAAETFVGHAWNSDGCWLLASTIAAEAGAGLPVQSTAVGVPGHANGEWMVLYNGPVAQSSTWQAMISTGDVVSFVTGGGGGHITTCVSGSGSTAQLIDNITYVDGSGHVMNGANDGSPNDILVAAPHAASQEWSGVQASNVVVYALDAPLVTDIVSAESLKAGASAALSALFSAKDPAQKAVTLYQAYDTSSSDKLMVNGAAVSAHSAATAASITTLSTVAILAGSTATSDTLEVRASNGSWWGDWESLAVTVTAAPSPPVLTAQTPAQAWVEGQKVSVTLPAGLFHDPQGQALSYGVTTASGAALPSWLSFAKATGILSGTAPATPQTLQLKVTATDTSGLSASEIISATVAKGASGLVFAAADWTGGAIAHAAPHHHASTQCPIVHPVIGHAGVGHDLLTLVASAHASVHTTHFMH